ncbi:MAG: hypothetical protein NPIRA04_15200 [Nitrospirales bacterium]|nr:MAG: hypothetical protein NPIRA04_15200 [Nitrospirales bacterium]
MFPDFNQKTIDTVAKRAAFQCSNPDCRALTVGPNSDPQKSTIIGEAAHIFGARPGSKRYSAQMTDITRAEITNAIWLCRNCHKLVDTDEIKHSKEILFAWREQHENYVQSELGGTADRIQLEQQSSELSLFEGYPPIIRRIVIDRPDGWEWRLTAELMRYLNQPLFQKIEDLRGGLYYKPQENISSEEVITWVSKRLTEASKLVGPIALLFERFNESWGSPGEPGNVKDIYHYSHLLQRHLEQIVLHEEHIHFADVPQEFEKVVNLLKDLLGSQAEKLKSIPDRLDEIVSLIGTDHGGTTENPHRVETIIEFELPKGWQTNFDREFRRAERRLSKGCGGFAAEIWTILLFGIFVTWLMVSIF